MTQEAMRPCPFCGKVPRASWFGPDTPGMEDCGYWAIECCDIHLHRDEEAEAIAAWNRRAQGAAPTGEALAMRELCASIAEEMRPAGGRAWTLEQKACYEALTACAENIRAITEAAPSNAEGPKPDGWRGIESAPKDGTRIIVCGEGGNVWCDVFWRKMIRRPDRWDSFIGELPFKPVWWQPRPAPPSSSQEGG